MACDASGVLGAYDTAVHIARSIGPREAATAGERRALNYAASRFRAAGLRVGRTRFRVPGHGTSGDAIGIYDAPGSCLVIYMAHADGVNGPGANDNASGMGVLLAIGDRVRAIRPRCDVWLVATGAEERPVTGAADHLGSVSLLHRVRGLRRTADLHLALSLDTLGPQRRFWLRSPLAAPGPGERTVLRAARDSNVTVAWHRDSSTGNSDHREFALAGLPAAVLEGWTGFDPCEHHPCDTVSRLRPGFLRAAQRVAERVLRLER